MINIGSSPSVNRMLMCDVYYYKGRTGYWWDVITDIDMKQYRRIAEDETYQLQTKLGQL